MVRVVWSSLFKNYATSYPHIFLLEKPLERYTGRELEYCVLRWRRVVLNWVREDEAPVRRKLESSEKAFKTFLIPGGRWLLVGSMDGLVQCFDLDAPSFIPAVLVPSQFDPNYYANHTMAVEIDLEAKSFTFNLALVITTVPRRTALGRLHSPRKIQVWRVTLDEGDHDGVQGFSSRCLCDFSEDREGISGCFSISLRGTKLAYFIKHQNTGLYTTVVDWSRVQDSSDVARQVFMETERAPYITLLREDKLFVVLTKSIKIYKIPNTWSNLNMLIPDEVNDQIPIWSATFASSMGTARSVSVPYNLPDSTRFVMDDCDNIQGVIIPCGTGSASQEFPQKVTLLARTQKESCGYNPALGYHIGLGYRTDGIQTMRYKWPDEQDGDQGMGLRKHFPGSGFRRKPAMDEASGRVILSYYKPGHYTVLDFGKFWDECDYMIDDLHCKMDPQD